MENSRKIYLPVDSHPSVAFLGHIFSTSGLQTSLFALL
jgi:hypothetical protein